MRYYKTSLVTFLFVFFHLFNHVPVSGRAPDSLIYSPEKPAALEMRVYDSGENLATESFASYSIVEKNNKKGLADHKGAMVIPASYDDLGWSEGMPRVIDNVIGYKENNFWGLINTKNSKVTAPLYVKMVPCSENFVITSRRIPQSENSRFGIINTKGKAIVPFNYNSLEASGDAIIGSLQKDNLMLYGVIDIKETVILPFEYLEIVPVSNSKLSVTNKDGKVGLFDNRGLKIIDFSLDSISRFEGKTAYIYQNGKKGLIDADGKVIVSPEYRNIVEESFGYRGMRFPEWQLLDGNNRLVQKFEFDQVIPGANNLYKVYLENKASLITKEEKYLISVVQNIDTVQSGLAIFSKSGKKGIVDSQGKVILSSDYDSIIVEESFICALKSSGQRSWAIFGMDGALLTKARYQDVKEEHSGLLPVKRNDHWGYISKAGHEVIPNQYDDVEPFSGLVAKARFLGSEGVINTQGDWIINPWHEYVHIINEDLFFFRTGKKNGLLSRINKEVYATENLLTPINAGFIEKNIEGKMGLLNPQGKPILKVEYDYISDLQGDSIYIFKKDDHFGVITKSGKIKIGLKNDFQELHPLKDNYMGVKVNNRYGFVDINGALRVSNQYDSIGFYNENLAPIKLRGNWGYIDKIERLIVQPAYDQALSFRDGLAIVMKNNKYGLINREGKIVLPLEFDKLEKTSGNRYLCYQGNKVGLASDKGRLLIYARYDEIEDLDNGFVIIKRQDKYGLMTVNGVDTIPMVFESLIYDKYNDLYLGKKTSEWVSVKNK